MPAAEASAFAPCSSKSELTNAREVADRELDRLGRMNPAALDYGIIRTYLKSHPRCRGTREEDQPR